MPATAPGWGSRSRAGWWRRTPAALRWRTARRAKRCFALRCRGRTRSRFCDGGRHVLPENVHVDVLEQADQGRGSIPGTPATPAVAENDLGIERFPNVAGERRGHAAAVQADELASLTVDE